MAGRSGNVLVNSFALSLFLLASVACVGYSAVGGVTKTIDRGNAESLKATFAIEYGQIDVGGGADALAEASFTTHDGLTPKVDYSAGGTNGTLSITQSSKTARFRVGPTVNRWSIELNDDVPLDLSVRSIHARDDLTLDTLTVKTLEVSGDSGKTSVSLSGVQDRLSSVSLKSSSGSSHLTLDGDYRIPATIDVESSSGDIKADLNGKWAGDVSGTFKTGSGSISLVVPKDVGVRIHTSTGSGYVDSGGMVDQGQGVYVNDAARSATVIIRLNIRTSSGNITLRSGH